MSATEHFMPIIPRHLQVLAALEAQRGKDEYGGIGWRGLLAEDEPFTVDQIFKPLIDRGLVEDLSETELGSKAGAYFVRITDLGRICLGLGLMLKDPRKTTVEELRKFGKLPAKLPPAPPPIEGAMV